MSFENLIIDLDGTLCESPAPHCMKASKLEDILREMEPVKIAKLKPREDVFNLIKELMSEHVFREIHIITGRWSILSSITRSWLNYHCNWIGISAVHMREFSNFSLPAIMVKEDMFHRLGLEPNKTIWIDDDNDMCAMANSLGIKVVKV